MIHERMHATNRCGGRRPSWRVWRLWVSLIIGALVAGSASAQQLTAWKATNSFEAPEAKQAAACDARFVYAVTNDLVAKYDRRTGERLAQSTGMAKHLNSAFLYDGRVYCAHSNYPSKPEQSEIRVLDPATMRLAVFKDFGNFGGSLTWAVYERDEWWCNFAHYGPDNRKTFLVRFDSQWKELGRWRYPPAIFERIGAMSFSGGIWHEGALLVSDHDHPRLYELRVPKQGELLELVGEHLAPITGQGFAVDPLTKGLVGIDRARRRVVFME